MKIAGIQKLSLLDFPEKTCATIFTDGCNLRCPFCHNASLVVNKKNNIHIAEEEIFIFLEKRKKLLDGICITGGEPLLQKDIKQFIMKIKNMGFLIKLDTNGTLPEQLQELLDENLLDYVAMDIKNCIEKYSLTVGMENFSTEPIKQSVSILKKGTTPFEFRTTLVREFHTKEDIIKIGKWLTPCKNYFLQAFKDSGELLCENLHGLEKEDMQAYKEVAIPFFEIVQIRGE